MGDIYRSKKNICILYTMSPDRSLFPQLETTRCSALRVFLNSCKVFLYLEKNLQHFLEQGKKLYFSLVEIRPDYETFPGLLLPYMFSFSKFLSYFLVFLKLSKVKYWFFWKIFDVIVADLFLNSTNLEINPDAIWICLKKKITCLVSWTTILFFGCYLTFARVLFLFR